MGKGVILNKMNDERRKQDLPEHYATDLLINAVSIIECNCERFVWQLRTCGSNIAVCQEQFPSISYEWSDEKQHYYLCDINANTITKIDKTAAIEAIATLPTWDSLTHEVYTA